MDSGWRSLQIDHNRRVRERLVKGASSGGDRFWGREAVIMFYEIVIALDGYAEMSGMPTPNNHKARRALVRRHFPHLADSYDSLYVLSLAARYYNGYTMTEKAWREAVQCHGILTRGVPVQ